jgi:uncharacterized protein YndB with AHSA1/START domain
MVEFEQIAPDTLRMERMLDAPVEIVWQWLVDPDLRRLWFSGGTAPKANGEVELVFDHDNLSEDNVPYPEEYARWQGASARERVLRYEPPNLLAFSWDGGQEGVATFELSDVGGRTRLVLIHSGISGPAGMANFGGGWMSHLAVLQAKLAGGSVADFWALHRASQDKVSAALR